MPSFNEKTASKASTSKIAKLRDGILIGADPELFIVDPNGKFVSAEGLIPGTKKKPFEVICGAIQVDGMSAEFNIWPAKTFEEFDHNFDEVLEALRDLLPRGYKLVDVPSVDFSEDVWEKTPEEAKMLGCSPDLNAWTGDMNPPPSRPTPRLCCAGGHIHIGYREDGPLDYGHVKNCTDLVKQLDWYLGAWSLNYDKDSTRRQLYGKSGACRIKPYGVEYRVLSNFWVLDKTLRLAVWNRLCQAIDAMGSRYYPRDYSRYNENVRQIIDDSRSDVLDKMDPSFPFKVKKGDPQRKAA